MEPLQNDSPADDSLQQAADTLESLIPTDIAPAPEQAPDLGAQELPPERTAPSIRPDWAADHRRYQDQSRQGFQRRLGEARRRFADQQREHDRHREALARQNELNQGILQLLQRMSPAEKDAIPDPLDPRFGPWLQKQLESAIDGRLSPIIASQRQQEEARQAQANVAEGEAQTRAMGESISSHFQAREREYLEAVPNAEGVTERIAAARQFLYNSSAMAGTPPDVAQQRADAQLFLIGHEAETQGHNGVAAMDAYAVALLRQAGWLVDEPDQSAQPYAQQYQAPPQTEAGRLARVQQRARPAASTSPRVSARTHSKPSELETIFAAGETNIRTLQAAALRETGGKMDEAAVLLNALLGKKG
jgi:hypothetical protein